MSPPADSLPKRARARLRSCLRETENMVQRRWRRALVAASRDWTSTTSNRSSLVLAAHPDDETFGCGATIARKAHGGASVRVLIATDGRNANPSSRALTPEQLGAVRRHEAIEACEILGVPSDHVVQPALPHLRCAEAVERVRGLLAELIDEYAPDEILVNTALDYHPDHKILNRIARQLVAETRYRGTLAEYPVWYLFDGPWSPDRAALAGRPTIDETPQAARGPLSRLLYRVAEPVLSVARLHPVRVASGPFLDPKRRAVMAHRSQVTNFTGEQDWGFLGPEFVNVFLTRYELFFPVPGEHSI
ncbi:MAG: PIG-L family deacetylase [Solirubrobacterales bacterium]|nr:PIG-L family deacetylase [Solirubrobacterales bacterium]